MKVLLMAAAAIALSASSASAQYPIGFYFPNGAPWCAYGLDCSYVNFAHCARAIDAPQRNCTKNPYFAAAYPSKIVKNIP
jgi:hypothetical protein